MGIHPPLIVNLHQSGYLQIAEKTVHFYIKTEPLSSLSVITRICDMII